MKQATFDPVDYVKKAFEGKRVLVTGHTGFKGSWLSLWLHRLGAEVSGLSLEPELHHRPLHDQVQRIGAVKRSIVGDIADAEGTARTIAAEAPEIVFHLAAQPLVRDSYDHPLATFRTNMLGTVNVLDAVRVHGTPALVCVTSDKCYENREQIWPYREIDPMGGWDPYSASKGAAELAVGSYRRSFFKGRTACASARAGNVIGGGDLSPDRLVPDFFRAMELDDVLTIRRPDATRPWQHVLESLSGYLTLGSALLGGENDVADAWNFGPEPSESLTVIEFVRELAARVGTAAPEVRVEHHGPHEAQRLSLDITKAAEQLKWKPALSSSQRIAMTADWYLAHLAQRDVDSMLIEQLDSFEAIWRSR